MSDDCVLLRQPCGSCSSSLRTAFNCMHMTCTSNSDNTCCHMSAGVKFVFTLEFQVLTLQRGERVSGCLSSHQDACFASLCLGTLSKFGMPCRIKPECCSMGFGSLCLGTVSKAYAGFDCQCCNTHGVWVLAMVQCPFCPGLLTVGPWISKHKLQGSCNFSQATRTAVVLACGQQASNCACEHLHQSAGAAMF